MAMAVERADHIAAAVQIEQRRVALVIRGRGPFRAHAAGIDGLDPDSGGEPVGEAARVDVEAPLPVIVGARPGRQFRAQCADFRVAHVSLPYGVGHRMAPRLSALPHDGGGFG